MSEPTSFSFHTAFDRNIGWLTDWEQQALRSKRIAIAGMGGVGGFHLLTLARLGIGAFNIADLDHFELANFNRQIGANMDTIGRPKAEVLAEMALAINPEIRMKRFDSGIDPGNIDAFLEDVDLFVDGFDFFVLDIRRKVFARCAELGIPAVTAAPIGMGVGFVAFTPNNMTFEEYFRLEGRSELRQYVNFLMGTGPKGLHRTYLVDPTRLDLGNHRAPSTVAGCQLCASVTAVAALKLLLRRGELKPAPYHQHFDAYRGKLAVTKLRWGNAGPLQRLKAGIAERAFRARLAEPAKPAAAPPPSSPLEEILDAARWAPSGDNAQPWRFEIVGPDAIIVHLQDASGDNVYEYRNAEPTIISGGMLLESMRIAATAFGYGMDWRYDGRDGPVHRIMVRFERQPGIATDPLYGNLRLRSVDRRPYRLGALSPRDKQALAASLGDGLALGWHEGPRERWRLAGLSARATNIRLRTPEAHKIHRRMLDWTRTQSPTGIPATAIGLDPLTLKVMRWAMPEWSRLKLLNRLGGPLAAALQMDLLPGFFSAGYFTIRLTAEVSFPAERIRLLLQAGQGIQRFWLTATRLGLAMQPALATLAFAHYGEQSASFTDDPALLAKAGALADAFKATLGTGTSGFVFMGRIGRPHARIAVHRSTRLPFGQLIETRAEGTQSRSEAA
jgi:molybdopterin/thiamine biosynthesis adenylyltransferase/nitroreductase